MATMEVNLGDSGVVHAIQTPRGVMFSMSEIASTIFHETPSAFAKFDLVPILKVALMKMVTQQSATLMAQGNLEDALALALDAIKQAQNIFYPKAPLQLVPLYLLAVQVCLSLGRSTQCQELLGIAAWLFLQGSEEENNHETRAEISRLFGQLYVLQNKLENALQSFAEEIYYVSKEHGVLDIRTSIGFYNSFKVLKTLGRFEDCLAFGDVVAEIWLLVMGGLVLNETRIHSKSFGDLDPKVTTNLKNSEENIQWVHINDVVSMLQVPTSACTESFDKIISISWTTTAA